MRIDRLLWFLRLSASRSVAQEWVRAGHIRLNGKRIEKPGTKVGEADVLTLPMQTQVRVIELLALPNRRGPALEAQSCYRVLDEGQHLPLAGQDCSTLPQGDLQP